MILTKDNNNYILCGIVLVAAILRLASPFDMPFTHDELSALFRTHFNSFHELIEKGVKVDGHPAAIQVFLFYWTKLFGYSELVVKIPFIAMGIFCVPLFYRVSVVWSNKTVGLIGATYIASLQYTISYSQIARPYISGLCFALLMVYFWQKVIYKPQNKLCRNAAGYIVAAALCAYNHHFSLLFAFITGIAGLFIIPRSYRYQYVSFGILIFVLYIPHLPIFLYQFQMKGVEEWLGKPHNDFIVDYVKFIFNDSPLVLMPVAALVVLGLVRKDKNHIGRKQYLLLLALFLAPVAIGFFYSRYVSAVLQYSVLIFSFPFILLLLFAHLPELNMKPKLAVVAILLTVNTISLVFERKFYVLAYQSPYEEILTQYQQSKARYGSNGVYIIDSNEKITAWYVARLHIDTTFVRSNTFASKPAFINFLQSQHQKYLYFGCLSGSAPELVPIIQNYFPKLELQKNYVLGTVYLFSNETSGSTPQPIYDMHYGFENDNRNWTNVRKENITSQMACTGKYSYYTDSTQEFGPTFSIPLKLATNSNNNLIDITVKIYTTGSPSDILLTTSLQAGEKTIDWRATSLNDFLPPDTSCHWVKIYHTIKLPDIYLHHRSIDLKVYLWNKGRNSFYTDDFEIKTREGNPVLYGLPGTL